MKSDTNVTFISGFVQQRGKFSKNETCNENDSNLNTYAQNTDIVLHNLHEPSSKGNNLSLLMRWHAVFLAKKQQDK